MPPITPEDRSMPRPKQPLTLSVSEAAELLGVSEKTVRIAVEKGQIEAMRIGRLIRIVRAPLLAQLGVSED
ncbi:MAG: helix-turn-helix domain-containing protein [Chloroflexi bacterium]|nr:helix-turn-helix domain-containing protein [Chloroflexota bacterium]